MKLVPLACALLSTVAMSQGGPGKKKAQAPVERVTVRIFCVKAGEKKEIAGSKRHERVGHEVTYFVGPKRIVSSAALTKTLAELAKKKAPSPAGPRTLPLLLVPGPHVTYADVVRCIDLGLTSGFESISLGRTENVRHRGRVVAHAVSIPQRIALTSAESDGKIVPPPSRWALPAKRGVPRATIDVTQDGRVRFRGDATRAPGDARFDRDLARLLQGIAELEMRQVPGTGGPVGRLGTLVVRADEWTDAAILTRILKTCAMPAVRISSVQLGVREVR